MLPTIFGQKTLFVLPKGANKAKTALFVLTKGAFKAKKGARWSENPLDLATKALSRQHWPSVFTHTHFTQSGRAL